MVSCSTCRDRWTPLEGDAELFTEYARVLTGRGDGEFVDVYSFNDLSLIEGLSGVIMVYPLNVSPKLPEPVNAPSIDFIKQDIDNACGTIAMLHILSNLKLIKRKELIEYRELHESIAAHGETVADPDTNLHFIAIVPVDDGKAYWLDGRCSGPIFLGSSNDFGRLAASTITSTFDFSSHYFSALAFVMRE